MAKGIKTQDAYNELWKHIGSQQVDDIHQIDRENNLPLLMGPALVDALIENACNQTGIILNNVEEADFKAKVGKIYG